MFKKDNLRVSKLEGRVDFLEGFLCGLLKTLKSEGNLSTYQYICLEKVITEQEFSNRKETRA